MMPLRLMSKIFVTWGICAQQVFVSAHQGAADANMQMLQQLKRHNYVTPTNYLQAVGSYR